MSTQAPAKNLQGPSKARLSIDTWAVALALAAVFLIRFGLVKHIGW